MTALMEKTEATCAVEVFIAAALLHLENPQRADFAIQEIVNRVAKENITGQLRSGINVHVSQHCVANKEPNPAKHRMLYATGKHTRRLLQAEDDVHPGRTGKIFPDADEIPERYLPVLDWAKSRYGLDVEGTNVALLMPAFESKNRESEGRWLESLFELEGLGKEHWKNVNPDAYVRQLREGWE